MKPIIAVATLLLALHVRSDAFLLTGPVTNPANGHSYYLLTEDNWTLSEAQALSLGGHLATITDTEENTWIYSTFGNFGNTSRRLWIGLSDQNTEGTFEWLTGDPVAFTPWASGQPDNAQGVEDYVHINGPIDLQPATWNDLPDISLGTYGVVEIIPEPSSFLLFAFGGLSFSAIARRRTHLAK